MTWLRAGYATILMGLVATPLLLPFRGLLDGASWHWTSYDVGRVQQLAIRTSQLCAGTVAIALPTGVLLAAILFRTYSIAHPIARFLILLLLFVPLTVTTSCWQTILGPEGLLPLELWRHAQARPWASGMMPAIWIHAMSALPWVTLIVGLGLSWVEPEREEEAAQHVGPWRVLVLVTLPRARASVLAAAMFIVLQTAGEISVTDMMQENTLAEEAHTQFTEGRTDALERTLIAFLPMTLLIWGAVLGMVAYVERSLPPLVPPSRPSRDLALGPTWICTLALVALIVLLAAPLLGLGWRLGLTGHPLRWDGGQAWHFLRSEFTLHGQHLALSLGTALVTGLLVSALALLGCWLARDRLWFRGLLFGVASLAWVLPGPVVGISVHGLIGLMVTELPEGPWTTLLYRGRSPIPLMWVYTIRTLPIAVVFLWPIVRMIPRELIEDARLAGARALGELTQIVLPLTWRATLVCAFIAAAVSVGEVGASARVDTPGWEPFAKTLFVRMHDGAQNTVAALSLLMLGSLTLVVGVSAGVYWIARALRS